MALQSSGQISLSQIAAEFGGSAPHSLSEYYGAASGVPASGQIKLAADFYGTANSFTTTLSWATHLLKSGNEMLGFVTSSSAYNGTSVDGATIPNSLGSIAAQPSTPNITHLFRTCASVAADGLELDFASTFTAWTSITIGSKTFTRASAATPGNRSGAITNRTYQWKNANNTTSTYITEDDSQGGISIYEDPFGTGSHGSGTPSGTVSITLNY